MFGSFAGFFKEEIQYTGTNANSFKTVFNLSTLGYSLLALFPISLALYIFLLRIKKHKNILLVGLLTLVYLGLAFYLSIHRVDRRIELLKRLDVYPNVTDKIFNIDMRSFRIKGYDEVSVTFKTGDRESQILTTYRELLSPETTLSEPFGEFGTTAFFYNSKKQRVAIIRISRKSGISRVEVDAIRPDYFNL